MPPESEEYRKVNPNSPFRTAAIGTKVTHKEYDTTGEVVGQEHDNFRIRWDDNKDGPTTWHGLSRLIIHWGSEMKLKRGDVVQFIEPTGERFVVTQAESNGDIEVLTEAGRITSISPYVRVLPNMRERGLAALALNDRRKQLDEALEEANAKIEEARQIIQQSESDKDHVLRSKGMLASLVDEMLHDS